MYWRRPLTRREAGLYAGLVGILVVVFASHMLDYLEAAERAAMQSTLINTTAAINVRFAANLVGQRDSPGDWKRRNPFEIAGATPPNFSRNGDPGHLTSGQWGFDAERAELVYLPRFGMTLHTRSGDGALRFRLVRGVVGYSLEPTAPFVWK